MACQSSHEAHTAPLAPSTDGAPAAGHHPDISPDPNVNSGEALEKQWDQPESPVPGSQDSPPPQGPNPETANEKENNAVLMLSFPRKLWRIVEDNPFTSVHWNDEGDMVVIEADLFHTEVLQRRGADLFERYRSLRQTASRASSVNLTCRIYRNSNFQRDKPVLLQNIRRKGNPRTTAQPITSATVTPKRKKHAVVTRRFQRFHRNESTQEADKKAQNNTPTADANPGQCSFLFCGLWYMGRVAVWARANHLPRTMTMYNTYFSIMMTAVSVVAQNKAPEAEEEQEESSDYKCAL
ncbi:hypothetical protein FD754_023053 [Muntiacus muntjak]|uniref:HSF-type DNA-binding domain-containing protein n=1 Tax=Muntiacus muntjak TaxID=9888 RepID=A0A5N3UUS1_MUNMU|nr:hypothetical protein FD754_023056 [Muntiacus muntjak]KAB0340528.1 hypothetical protein FD754_023053 [Muntiacus muntjak]